MTLEDFKSEILPLKDRLYRYTLSLVHREELAKDITQEVFIKVWERRKDMIAIKNKEAWCVRCARNLSFDKMKAKSNQARNLDEVSTIKDPTAQPYRLTESQDMLIKVKELMEGLPEQQREIFQLRELAGYTNLEIQEVLGLSNSQVKVNLFRARKKIRESLIKIINYGLQEN